MLYIYMIASVLMIVFNIAYMGARRGRDELIAWEAERIGKKIAQTMECLEKRKPRTVGRRIKQLQKYLSGTLRLLAFNSAMENVPHGPERDAFLREMNGAFLALGGVFRKKNPIVRAYFAYTLTLYQVNAAGTALSERLFDDVVSTSMYLRENSLNALCRMGDAPLLSDAIAHMSRLSILHTHKLITDTLLRFTGDHEELCSLLFNHYPDLREEYRLAVVNYIGYKSSRYAERFQALLRNAGKEIRIAMLRYLRKHPRPEAEDVLLDALRDEDPAVWECAAVAASALSVYRSEKTRAALRTALSHSNWYIRQNAADSLLQMELTGKDIHDIMQSDDRYAVEMFQYRLNEKAFKPNDTTDV